MRIAKVYGNLTLNRSIESLQGASLKLVCPLDQENLYRVAGNESDSIETDETLVAWDLIGVGNESLVAISEGPEAAMPLRPQIKPVDTSITALLDSLYLENQP